jgi:steroid 5-alpha reductase family enzyme
MPQPLALAIVGWAMVAVLMTAIWLWHLRLRNVGVVDVGWTASLTALACLYAFLGTGLALRRIVIAAMIAVWGTRLCVYLLRDRVLGRREDMRYADLRARDSWVAAGSFYPFFQAQALLAAILSVPALLAAFNPAPELSALEWSAIALWAVALAGEAIADRQLETFKATTTSHGKTFQGGLWRYSRHPNYFFEWLVWVAYAAFALASPWGPLALVCPAIMLYLLFRVTGIPATEAQALRSRGDDYRRYQQTTSAFVPWPRRRLS